MAQEIKIPANPRNVRGSTAARRIRRSGEIPAVLATLNGESELISLNAHDFEREIARHTNARLVVTVQVGEVSRVAIIRELQRDGITGRITHVDFGEVNPAEKMTVQVPLYILGESVGVRTENGELEQSIRKIELVCLPADVIEALTVDITNLHVEQAIKVADLGLDAEKYTLVTPAEQVIVACKKVETKVVAAVAAPETKGKGKKK